ncbi:TonB-dependent receptor [Hydrocarboniphaga sp.]|uniref:TonB-dependent receptor n=1 Tax=Hydrocarboniphaga sp. TaxID=2033016 RepID=UPI003D0CBCE9
MPKSIAAHNGRLARAGTLACLLATTNSVAAQQSAADAPNPATPSDETSATPLAGEATAELGTIPVAGSEAPAAEPLKRSSVDEPVQLEEVIVTATKRQKSLRDIPASITAFDGNKLEEQGKLGLNDYLQQSPGVTMTQIAPMFPRISIRGISTDTAGLSALPSPTGILIGDVAFSDPYISNVQPDLAAFDLASVEVLKGPQGTLFGGAALAGAIRYVLTDPVMGEWHARGFSQVVSPDSGSTAFSEGAVANIPLYSDALALRVGYVHRQYSGVTDLPDKNPPEKNVDHGNSDQIRAILAWQPLDDLKFKLTHLQQDYSAPNSTNTADTPDKRERNHQVLPAPVHTEFQLDSLEAAYDFAGMRAISLSSYSTKSAAITADATSALIGPAPAGYPRALAAFQTINDDSHAFAQEIRLQSTGSDGFQWLVGAYLYDYKVRFEIFADTLAQQALLGNGSLIDQLLNGVRLDSSTLYNKSSVIYALSTPKASERALFFDLSDKFWDRLEISAGARLYTTEVKGGFFGTGVLALAANNGQDVDYSNNSIKENGISPKLAATFHFTRDLSLYAQAARGFRFGGLQSVPSSPTNNVPPTYKSDSLWNYETGLRTAWLDNTLHADVTVFDIEYKNPQIGQTTTGVPLNYTDNVGAARSRGLEASMRWLTPLPGFSIALDAALTDSKTTEAFSASNGDDVPAGTQMPGAAKSQYTVEGAYLLPLGAALVGTNLNYSYIGKGYADITHSVPINDYGTLNAGLTLTTDAWAIKPVLAFNVSNILNATEAVGGSTITSVTQITYTAYQLNAPRTYSVRLSLDF